MVGLLASENRRREFRSRLWHMLAMCNKGESPQFWMPQFSHVQSKGNKRPDIRKLCVGISGFHTKMLRAVPGTRKLSKNIITGLCHRATGPQGHMIKGVGVALPQKDRQSL